MDVEEEKALRAKIAYDIRAELVCCDMYRTVQLVDKLMQEKNNPMWEPETVIKGYHAICHWGEVAARIVEGHHEPLPVGLCGNKAEHEPHEQDSPSLGKFWCTADQKTRLPHAAEVRRINSD